MSSWTLQLREDMAQGEVKRWLDAHQIQSTEERDDWMLCLGPDQPTYSDKSKAKVKAAAHEAVERAEARIAKIRRSNKLEAEQESLIEAQVERLRTKLDEIAREHAYTAGRFYMYAPKSIKKSKPTKTGADALWSRVVNGMRPGAPLQAVSIYKAKIYSGQKHRNTRLKIVAGQKHRSRACALEMPDYFDRDAVAAQLKAIREHVHPNIKSLRLQPCVLDLSGISRSDEDLSVLFSRYPIEEIDSWHVAKQSVLNFKPVKASKSDIETSPSKRKAPTQVVSLDSDDEPDSIIKLDSDDDEPDSIIELDSDDEPAPKRTKK